MKTLIVYFSRTGMTRKVAEELKIKLNADIEEITDPTDRRGMLGYLKCGKEAMQKISAPINPIKSDFNGYDLVIVGTPIWGWNICSPIRGLMVKYGQTMKKIAVFCTQGGSGAEIAVKTIEELSGKKTIAYVAINNKEMNTDAFSLKLAKFVESLK